MQLDTYKTLAEKEEAFITGYKRIENSDEFDEWYENLSKKHKIFRGLNEAKYKNYTSAQRHYIENDLEKKGINVNDFIKEELKQIKQVYKGLLKNYYNLLEINENDLLYLSFLQHYTGASPLLDFSANVDKALFFMLDEHDSSENSTNNIDKYFSLYYFDIKRSADGKYDNVVDFDILKYAPSAIVIHKQSYCLNGTKIDLANLNFVAQDGRFIFHCKGKEPLQEDISCVDIHKSLATHIKKLIRKEKIFKKYIYPKEEKVAQSALKEALKKLKNEQ